MRLDSLLRDIRFAFRIFQRSPAVALTVIGTLAIALGLNATAFSLFNAYVFRPAEVREPSTLYLASWENQRGARHLFSWRESEQFRRDMADIFTDTVAFRRQVLTRIDAQPLMGQLVSGNYFQMLGITAFRGRTLVPADTATPGGEPVVVISHAAWTRVFGADPAIVGRRIQIRGVQVEIVGVATEAFAGLDFLPYDFWAPVTMASAIEDGPNLFGPEQPQQVEIIGRLRPDRTEGAARAAVLRWAQQATLTAPTAMRAARPILESTATPITLSLEVALGFAPVAVAFGLVLLTAAANIAGLMLSRVTVRQREIAIRMSLGASRAHIVRQFLTESLLLALVASAIGFVLARGILDVGIRIVFASLPEVIGNYIRLLPIPPDLRVMAFMLGAAAATALLFGALPALQATRRAGTITTHGATPDARSSRLRHGLVIAQITVSALLIVTCGVLLRGAIRLADAEIGLRTQDMIEIQTGERSNAPLLATLRAHPLVSGITLTSHGVLSGGMMLIAAPEGTTAREEPAREERLPHKFVSPNYFDLLEIPITGGRTFTSAEASGGVPVVVLSREAADLMWPGQNPLGRAVRLSTDLLARGPRRQMFPVVEVIGVVGTVANMEASFRATIYLPTSEAALGNRLVVRTTGGVTAAARQIEEALDRADPGAIQRLITIEDLATAGLFPFRAASWLAGIIGVIALALTISGIYGVLSYAVARRTKEIGIRVALGATAQSIVGLILTQSLRLCAVGLAIGLALALALSILLSSVMVMMEAFDLIAFAAGIIIVVVACLAAAFHPARRASRVEPLVALRIE
jgi:predicted permease